MTFRHILANLAAVVALSSCTKEVTGPVEPVIGGGERVITATFGSVSKSHLGTDGLKPVFTDGDLITVTNGAATQVCTVRVNGSVATFATRLGGTLEAVYPKDAAVLSGNDITGVKVLSEQTGLFKDANIAKADIPASSTSAVFHIQTAVLRFYVDASIKVKKITVIGSLDIASEGSDKKQIVVDPDDALINTKTTGNPDPRLCYVAVLPGPVTGTEITANNLAFTSDTDTQGTVTRTTTAKFKTAGMYNAFIPYYIDLGTAGKWAYCNVGAFLPEEAGKYFAWGDTAGQYAATNGAGAFTVPFNWAHTPFNNGSSSLNSTYLNNNKSTFCPGNVLALQYDAAYANWGEDWRMPTREEFSALLSSTGTTSANFSNGVLTVKNTQLIFPAGGSGRNNGFQGSVGSHGFCWSSTLNTANSSKAAYDLRVHQGAVDSDDRYYGLSIRPIYNGAKGLDVQEHDAPINID